MANRRYEPLPPTDSSPPNTLQRDAQGRILPTPELQELYNNWREAEQQLEFETELRLRDGQGNLDPNDALLRPRSPSATSTSCTSAVSITHGLGSVGLNDNPVSENGTKSRKAKRHGPLGKDTKARAALVRKLVSCPSCKSRKVKCHHHDLSLFKSAYDLRRNQRQAPIQPRPRLTVPSYTNGPAQPMSPTTMPGPASESDLLRGIGGDIARFPGPTTGSSDDPDDPLRLSPGGGLSPVQTRPTQMSPFDSYSSLMPMTRPTNTSFQMGLSPPPQLTFQDRFVPIGRQQVAANIVWECQGYRASSSRTSMSSTVSETCLECFTSLGELQFHYQCYHANFRDPSFLYKCLHCDFISIATDTCLQCANANTQWESWCYGYVGSSSNSSLPYTHLFVGQDEPTSAPYSGNQGMSGGYNNNYTTGGSSFFNQHGWFGGGNGNGSGSGSVGNNQFTFDQNTKEDCSMTACNDVVVETLYMVCQLQDTLPGPSPMFHRRLPGLSISGVVICLLPFVLACIILYTAVLQGCSTSDCIGIACARMAARFFQLVRAHISAISMVCVLVGLLVVWLFKHIRFRMRHGRSLSLTGQYCFRDVLRIGIDHGSRDSNVSRREADLELCRQTQRMMSI